MDISLEYDEGERIDAHGLQYSDSKTDKEANLRHQMRGYRQEGEEREDIVKSRRAGGSVERILRS